MWRRKKYKLYYYSICMWKNRKEKTYQKGCIEIEKQLGGLSELWPYLKEVI